MPAPKIEFRKLTELTKDPRNARTHSASQIELIAGSIRRFGWTFPMLVDDVIRAGNGRFEAATLIYADGEAIHMAPGKDHGGAKVPDGCVPVIDCSGWTDEERTAYALADNQLALQAGWDEDVLREQLTELQATDFDIPVIGFDESQLAALFATPTGKTDPDDIPKPEEVPVTIAGDVWILGDHRIACGDSTDPETVKAALGGHHPLLMVTDPPYGVNYDPSWRTETGINKVHQKVAHGVVKNDDRADWKEAWDLFPGDVAYVWHGGLHSSTVEGSLRASGFEMRSQIVWAKASLVIGRGDYHWRHEPCWYAVRKGKKGHWAGDRKQSTVWEIANMHATQGDVDDGKTVHGTQKPVECMLRPMENNSRPGDSVYEPFSGSGTTIIAGEQSGRRVLAVELNPIYVDVAVRRWAQFTGRDPVLEATGQTFAEVEADRLGDSLES